MEFLLDGFRAVTWQQGVMYLVGFALIYLAIQKDYEPALLLPMGFGAILVNLPSSGVLNQMVEVDEREAHEVHHALLPRHGSKAVKQKAHKCNTLLYYRIGFRKRKRLLPSDGCKDAFGKSLAIS